MSDNRCPLMGIRDEDVFDIVVLGAGAAGMSAALFAALEGQRVLLVERTEYLGGTSALSAATAWVPLTRHSTTYGTKDSVNNVLGYLDRAVGNHAPRAMRETFVEHGPDAIHTLEDKSDVRFRPRPFHPDYLHEMEGSTSNGRAVEPKSFDARVLGDDVQLVRPPIPEFTILGGLMIDRDDIAHLLKMKTSLKSLAYSLRLVGRYYLQKMRYGRDMRFVMGNALIGRLLLSLRKQNVAIVTRTQVTNLALQDGGEYRLTLADGSSRRQVTAQNGVILASGGFARHPSKRQEFLPDPAPAHSPSAPGHTGELHDIVLKMGAYYGDSSAQPCFWAPVSHRKRADGSTAAFPHFVLDRSKPGIISVGRDGKRFMNESRSYHEFVSGMYAANKDRSHIPTFLVADARAITKYGLGMIRPGGANLKPFLADGYLTKGDTLAELASKLDMDAAGLKDSVSRMNSYAETGVDEEFARGSTVYERSNGDADHGPNPTLGKLATAPYYAVRLWPGDIGSAKGLVTDEQSRLLATDGTVINGLYAVGADMNSIMGGVYPGPGSTIGPGIVFGYIAAKSASRAKT